MTSYVSLTCCLWLLGMLNSPANHFTSLLYYPVELVIVTITHTQPINKVKFRHNSKTARLLKSRVCNSCLFLKISPSYSYLPLSCVILWQPTDKNTRFPEFHCCQLTHAQKFWMTYFCFATLCRFIFIYISQNIQFCWKNYPVTWFTFYIII